MNDDLKDDWRLQGQESYLKGVKLIPHKYQPDTKGWDHDHCEFCGAKFSTLEGDINFGYSTIDSYYWICNQCFNDFKNVFKWIVDVESENG